MRADGRKVDGWHRAYDAHARCRIGNAYLLLRLAGGKSSGATFVPGPSHPEAGFTLRAPYPLWREILGGKTLAATAILMGRMKVEGNTVALLKHAGAHRSLMHCVSSLDTRYP